MKPRHTQSASRELKQACTTRQLPAIKVQDMTLTSMKGCWYSDKSPEPGKDLGCGLMTDDRILIILRSGESESIIHPPSSVINQHFNRWTLWDWVWPLAGSISILKEFGCPSCVNCQSKKETTKKESHRSNLTIDAGGYRRAGNNRANLIKPSKPRHPVVLSLAGELATSKQITLPTHRVVTSNR